MLSVRLLAAVLEGHDVGLLRLASAGAQACDGPLGSHGRDAKRMRFRAFFRRRHIGRRDEVRRAAAHLVREGGAEAYSDT